MSLLLGCIADDFTGGTDLAGMLVKAGMRTVQLIGVPDTPLEADVDAVVIALKSRTNPAPQAVAQSLAALAWLRKAGCRQIYFKYCSTFDSTPNGNIGPVAGALMDALGTDFAIACPAFPANGRTIYKGNLFVGNVPLNESGMRNHPLTPMTDANIVRVLQAQVKRKVGLVDYAEVRKGAEAIGASFVALREQGVGLAVVDAIDDSDLVEIGRACARLPLVTAGSGLALGLPQNFHELDDPGMDTGADSLPTISGHRAIISGSCSVATNAQVARMKALQPAFNVDPPALANGDDVVGAALRWAASRLAQGPVLIYATAEPAEVKAAQSALGADQAGALVEDALSRISVGLVELGVRQIIVAGGETSGAVVKALGVSGLRIGPEIVPGVPWTMTIGRAEPLVLALKSGNFGGPDFFLTAWDKLT